MHKTYKEVPITNNAVVAVNHYTNSPHIKVRFIDDTGEVRNDKISEIIYDKGNPLNIIRVYFTENVTGKVVAYPDGDVSAGFVGYSNQTYIPFGKDYLDFSKEAEEFNSDNNTWADYVTGDITQISGQYRMTFNFCWNYQPDTGNKASLFKARIIIVEGGVETEMFNIATPVPFTNASNTYNTSAAKRITIPAKASEIKLQYRPGVNNLSASLKEAHLELWGLS
jgi:hypothetical protein